MIIYLLYLLLIVLKISNLFNIIIIKNLLNIIYNRQLLIYKLKSRDSNKYMKSFLKKVFNKKKDIAYLELNLLFY